MPSLTDLFNPTFFMFLGILVLVVALLVVYFESKIREQNHKITSMLSLVSSLAEELNGVKFGLNHLSRRGGIEPSQFFTQNHLAQNEVLDIESKLITVSDDEDDEDDYDEDEEGEESSSDDVSTSDDESITNEEIDFNEPSDVKVLKLNINSGISDEIVDFEIDDFNLDISDEESLSSKKSESSIKDSLDLLSSQTINEENKDESNIILQTDLKKISINLEEQLDSLDYKKFQLPKLRSIVTEKGLVTDSSKLKKNELLKLLGAE